MCSGNPWGEMALATKMEANNPFSFFYMGDAFIIPTGGWWPLLAASVYGLFFV